MICNECGREMPDSDKFCVICGTPNPNFESAAAPAQDYPPQPQPVNEFGMENEYRAFDPSDIDTAEEDTEVKRTCSLSVVVFCAVVIFMLSVACGVFAGLYFSGRNAALAAPYSVTEYDFNGDN